jgi:hypothetical protein
MLTGGSSPASVAALPTAASDSQASDWFLHEFKNKMDNTPEVVLRNHGSDGAALIIRCSNRKTDAYVNTDTIVDNGSVRVRFDDSGPVREGWSKSTDHKALFAPGAITLARQLAKAHIFLDL